MIKAIAIDDEPMPLNILSRYSQETDKVELIKTFTSTQAANNWLSVNHVDLLFLDINMPAQSGLDFFKSLKNRCMVIFTTAHSEFAIEGFNLKAVDYLLKPYSLDRFMQGVDKAFEFHQYQIGNIKKEIFIKADYSLVKISTEDILFIEAYTDYLKIHRISDKVVVTRMTMNHILDLLPKGFMRIHRSYIVPFNKVRQWANREVIIGNIEIPIGKTYYKKVQEILKSNSHRTKNNYR